ncbi:MAG TPA: MBL fold metallo-hydrolase, partial [Desulfobacteria bacterium]|nr:MBL fold metallo-hydrolase [Desulfobacteria bacterium]
MIIECLEVGHLGANCYVVGCEKTGEAAVIDPGGDADEIIGLINEKGLKVKYIVNTHGHLDHVAGNDPLRDATGAPVLIHEL